jgi:hypothetical protein
MTTFVCSSCRRTISASSLIEREPMCRACRKARATPSRRPSNLALILAPLCAAGLAAVCLSQGFHSPFDGASAVANFAFWVVGGMAVGLVIRSAGNIRNL